jgi:hypothetical protein
MTKLLQETKTLTKLIIYWLNTVNLVVKKNWNKDGDDYGFRVKSGPRDVNVELVNVAGHEGEGQTLRK